MSVIFPPLWTSFGMFREIQARLTPFWTARRQTDEIIELDRRLIREYEQRLRRDPSGSHPEDDGRVGISVMFNDGFYFIWTGTSRAPGRTSCPSACSPLTIVYPDYIVVKSKLRRDQIEYLEQKRMRDHA